MGNIQPRILLLVSALILVLFTGCGSSTVSSAGTSVSTAQAADSTDSQAAPENVIHEDNTSSLQDTEPSAVSSEGIASEASSVVSSAEPEEIFTVEYPLESSETLSVFMEFQMNLSSFCETIADMPAEKMLREDIGINIEHVEVSMASVSENFNLMVASGDMSDIICGGVAKYSAGLDAAVDENVYTDLLDYLPEYAPDYWSMLNEDPAFLKIATTDEGRMAALYGFNDEPPIQGVGLVIRGDLLEQTGLSVPQTYDELEAVLIAFQNLGLEHPMYSCFGANSYTSSGFDVPGYGFFVKDGEIRFSVVEEGYRQYIQKLRDWYALGFYSEDWLSLNNPMVDEAITTGLAGVFEQSVNRFPQILSSMSDPNATFTPMREPAQKAGQPLHFASLESRLGSNSGTTITTSCQNIPLALNYLNYFYTEAGILAYNYGIEGVSYTINDNGEPEFTDLIINNPDGLSITQAQDYYTYNGYAGRVTMQRVSTMFFDDNQNACPPVWSENNDNLYIIPGSVTRNSTEADIYSTYYSDIETLVEEQLTKYIVGDLDMTEYDSFVEEIRGMGLDQVLDVYQSAYDRYLTR